MKKLRVFLFVIVSLALLASGCTGSGGSSGSSGDTTKDNILHVAKDTDIRSLDTNVATDGLSFEVIETFTDSLLDYDAAGNLIPRLAESWSVSEDGLTWTFNLRKDATWSNGDPVTAHDFVFSWRRLASPDLASDYNYMVSTADIVNAAGVMDGSLPLEDLGVEAVDDYTLVVHLAHSVPYFDQLMTFPVFNPLNEAFVTAQGDNYALSVDALLSCGPFILTEWTPGSGWKVTKNPDYYDADSIKIDGIDFILSSDYQASALLFENGQVDITKLSASLVDQYSSNPAFQQVPDGYLWYLSLNFEIHPELRNVNLRLAMAWAIDRDNITQNIMKDGSYSAYYMIPIGLATGPDGKDFRDGGPTYYGYDLEKAKEYLELAKAELGVDSFTFEFLIEDSEEAKNNAAQIQADLAEIGITLEIVSVPKSERLSRMNKSQKDFQIGMTRWGPDYADPNTYLGDNFSAANSYLIEFWNNADYNACVADIVPGGALSTDVAARWDRMYECEAILMAEVPIIPIWQSGISELVSTRVHGLEQHVVGLTSYRNITLD
ncbi:MAG: peptide ABC transporter substrate-binding protein [Erysipelotrichaceae bacterium]|jgi:oligopeptide transport system substrate-binding protein|nr:peptide ABC transporter substrate-binding protein [Erysipelotrichaceae bacterium]